MTRSVSTAVRGRLRAPSTWRESADCSAMGDYYFFAPEQETAAARLLREDAARSSCARCLVLEPCRRYGLDTAQPHGIWGGLTELERTALLGQSRAS
ncbi:WhiB family transcriptional regulator [Rhodococcus sp. NPDC057014]|uniref:WhiB family transcriptional regulator n=1 Tax=Rhodococcus sp. NPDC057014 TaxID=3346000 RepID=UPI003627786C